MALNEMRGRDRGLVVGLGDPLTSVLFLCVVWKAVGISQQAVEN
jgi:hypothetical protein